MRKGVDGLVDVVVGHAVAVDLQKLAGTVAQEFVKSNL